MSIRAHLTSLLAAACRRLVDSGGLAAAPGELGVTASARAGQGDYASAVALKLAAAERQPPRALAAAIQAELGDGGGLLERCEVAGAGYLNFTVAPARWRQVALDVAAEGARFVCSPAARRQRILVEHVSANPTGPLHVAHGRGAVIGDVVANLLAAAGHEVQREYYVNDMGRQVEVMARSVWAHYLVCAGRPWQQPEEFYPGAYVQELAAALFSEEGAAWADDEAAALPRIAERAVVAMVARIRDDLASFGVRYDRFVSERQLSHTYDLGALVQRMAAAGTIFHQDGKTWLRTTALGDDKDRVVVRDDGRPTYFAGDIAYHHDKVARGFDRLINVWGADHDGYVARVRAGMAALGDDPGRLQVLLMQMVSLSQGGAAVRMGKRLGTAVWLREVVGQVGSDAFRYLFVTRRCDAQMDFDVDLARRQSLDNPVFYAQMGHARLAAIARRAAAVGLQPPPLTLAQLACLTRPEELALLRSLARAPEVVADAAAACEPHLVASYLQALIGQFHSYYTGCRADAPVIGPPGPTTWARLGLCRALKTVMAALLGLLGVSAPEQMTAAEAP